MDGQVPGKCERRARDRVNENAIPGAHEEPTGRRPDAESEKHHGPQVHIEPLQNHPDHSIRQRSVIR